jgi:tetratricopeptide (TPR) repeat protein
MNTKQLSIVVGLFLNSLIVLGQIEKAKEYYRLGDSMIDTGPFPAVIDNLRKAIELDSTGDCGIGLKGFVHGELGYAYLSNGDTTNALRFYDRSILLDPTCKNSYPRLHKAFVLWTQKKAEPAYKLNREVINKMPTCADAYAQRGFFYESDNKIDLAIKDFKVALELNSKEKRFPQAYIDRMNAIIARKKQE